MSVRYKEAFGLSDNPFGPLLAFDKVPPNLTLELAKRPLFVHKNDGLDQLCCEKISSFKKACDKFEGLLEVSGYTANPVGRGVTSYLISVQGDRGAGKTTLASRMLQLTRKRTPVSEPEWNVEELSLRSIGQTVTEQAALIKALEKKILDKKAMYNCVLVDDLLADAYPYVTQMYDTLTAEFVAFIVFTCFDRKIAEHIDKSLHTVKKYEVEPLSPDDAMAYVAARYALFRLPVTPGILGHPVFPFDESDIRQAVQGRVWTAVPTTAPVTMRLFASILADALARRLEDLATSEPAFDLSKVPASRLPELQIQLAASYQAAVRK
jgi:hypothetical protein